MTDVLDCPVCAGVGVLDAPVRTCPSCDGTGIVTVEQYMRLRGYPRGMDHLPALLDAVDALRGLRRYPANTVSAEVYEMRRDAALAALEQDGAS